ncbi:MAG TPA: hypothetical protein VIN10_11330 [Bacteroidales bacterium]
MSKTKNAVLWIVAIILTLSLVVYQRATGPTYPVNGKVVIGNETIKYKLLRTQGGDVNAPVEIEVADKEITGKVTYKRFKSFDEWTTVEMEREGDKLVSSLPNLPPAGKIEYTVHLYKNGIEYQLNEDPAVLRYKGEVPLAVLVPHIFFMFIAMLFAWRAGLEALFKGSDNQYFTKIILITLGIGGLILGPIVQKYAFDAYWTGWPFGNDLTDNKTLATFIFWLIAWFRLSKKPTERTWVFVAFVVMIATYIIPHSTLGSEIDYTKEENLKIENTLPE